MVEPLREGLKRQGTSGPDAVTAGGRSFSLPLEVVRYPSRATPWVVSRLLKGPYSGGVMGIRRRRLEAASLALVLLCASSAALLPVAKAAGCGCPMPCVKCCCAADIQGDAEFCVVRDRGSSAPPSDVPPASRLRVREAVFASPALLSPPILESRLWTSELRLPVSLVLSPEVPPPRATDCQVPWS